MDKLTGCRNADEGGECHGHLGEAPGARKVPRAHLLEDVHLEGVDVAAVRHAVDPHEDVVPVVLAETVVSYMVVGAPKVAKY